MKILLSCTHLRFEWRTGSINVRVTDVNFLPGLRKIAVNAREQEVRSSQSISAYVFITKLTDNQNEILLDAINNILVESFKLQMENTLRKVVDETQADISSMSKYSSINEFITEMKVNVKKVDKSCIEAINNPSHAVETNARVMCFCNGEITSKFRGSNKFWKIIKSFDGTKITVDNAAQTLQSCWTAHNFSKHLQNQLKTKPGKRNYKARLSNNLEIPNAISSQSMSSIPITTDEPISLITNELSAPPPLPFDEETLEARAQIALKWMLNVNTLDRDILNGNKKISDMAHILKKEHPNRYLRVLQNVDLEILREYITETSFDFINDLKETTKNNSFICPTCNFVINQTNEVDEFQCDKCFLFYHRKCSEVYKISSKFTSSK